MKTIRSPLKSFRPALARTLAVIIIWGLSLWSVQAGYIVTLSQVGPDVVATGSGPIDLTGLTPLNVGSVFGIAATIPSDGNIITGSGDVAEYTGLTGPMSFGSGGLTIASSSSLGDPVGIDGVSGTIFLPQLFVGGPGSFFDNATYNGVTFASLGVTPGTYEWTWGTGANQNFTLQIGPAGVPDSGSAFGLLVLGLAALFGASRLRALRLA